MPTKTTLSVKTPSPPVHYRVDVLNANAHLFQVTLTITAPAAAQRVSLPVWNPGSYLIREFAKNLQRLSAHQGARGLLPVKQLDKCTWQITGNPAKPLVLRYEIYASDNSVRTTWLDGERGFFNGTSLCLRVEGQTACPQVLEIPAPKGVTRWSLATGLVAQQVDKNGFGSYAASDYDELVDCPVEMGAFWSGNFTACGVPHRFVVAGALPSFDGAKLLADTQKICETQIRFWHGTKKPPFKNYLFLLNAVNEGYGGLEHRNSTALICNRKDLPRLDDAHVSDGHVSDAKVSESYATLRGLISHEYFHTWNVKRLRPDEFAPYRYDRENYTELLWFFEGFTSYYDDLLLRRAGLLDNVGYLRQLNKTINQVMQAPGRFVQSVAEASFDAWVKYYRQDDNTPNATISYYTKGALVALCFDLTLRAEGHTTLDDVMRGVWARCHQDGRDGPMREADFADVLQALGKRSFAPELAQWVHSTAELPLLALLRHHGVAVRDDPAQLAQRLGLRVTETDGVRVKIVLRGGAAEKAGFAAGDEWLGIELPSGGWRLQRLDDVALLAGSAKKVTALISRDKRLLRLPLNLATPASTWRLVMEDSAKVDHWLG